MNRNERKALGLCTKCDDKPEYGTTMCSTHHLKNRLKWAERAERQAAKGLCIRCNDPVKPGLRLCEKHYAAIVKVAAERQPRMHACLYCTTLIPGNQVACVEHKAKLNEEQKKRGLAAWKERSHRRLKDGLCSKCNTPRVANKSMCEKHLEANRNWVKECLDRKRTIIVIEENQ